jgi:hypothetical protein
MRNIYHYHSAHRFQNLASGGSGYALDSFRECQVWIPDETLSRGHLLAPWPESESEPYRQNDRRLSAKLMPTFADRWCCVVSTTDLYDRILGFPDRSRYFFFQVAPQLYSRGWLDPVPDPLLIRKSGSAGDRTRTSGSVGRNSAH